MMVGREQTLIGLLILLTVACNSHDTEHKSNSPPNDTEIFSYYLQEQFQTSIKDSLHYYVLLPNAACSGCVKNNLIQLNNFMTPRKADYFTIIYTNAMVDEQQGYMPSSLRSKVRVWKDTSGLLDRINLGEAGVSNITIVKTKQDSVWFVKSTVTGDTTWTNWVTFE